MKASQKRRVGYLSSKCTVKEMKKKKTHHQSVSWFKNVKRQLLTGYDDINDKKRHTFIA